MDLESSRPLKSQATERLCYLDLPIDASANHDAIKGSTGTVLHGCPPGLRVGTPQSRLPISSKIMKLATI
jgi:hypothetical protein